MKQRLLFMLASLMVCLGAMAQWTHPEPAKMDIVYGDTVYLYNVEAQGFFRGANSWGTRASVDAAHGYKCVLLQEDGYVAIKDSVEDKGKMYYVRSKNYDDIYVDCNDADMGYRYFQFDAQADGSYTIQSLSEGLGGYLLGVDLTSDNNTVLWFIDTAEHSADQIQTKWWIVSMTAYNEYMVKYANYAAAEALGKKIEEAKGYGIDASAAEKVYSNTASTKDELDAAAEALQKSINDYKENAATPENPQDLTDTFIPDGDFELNQGAGVWQRTHSAQNYQTSGTAGKMGDSTTFLEAWHSSQFTGKMYVPITGLPNGVYQFFLSVATNGGNGCYVYAGTDSVEVTTGDTMTPYSVFTRVEDGTLEVGLNLPNNKQNWIGIDDAKLLYLGNSVASYSYWVKTNQENAPHYEDDYFIQTEALAAYNELLNTDPSTFSTVEEVLAYNDKFNEAVATIKANEAAYAKYADLVNQANALQTAGYAGEEADDLYDYLSETAEDIALNRAYTTEQMLAECEVLAVKIETVKSKCLAEGMDCTNLMVNPNFDNKNVDGWSHDTSLASPVAGGLTSNPNAECWNANFDFYQQLTDIPNGVYELKVQAFYRPTGDTKGSYENYIADPNTDEILTVIYANTNEKPVKNIGSETFDSNLENNCSVVADNLYCPNGMNSASNAFSQGAYENSVVGVVTDGNLKIGIKSNGSASGRWSLWDNFRLTYIGMNKEAIDGVIATYEAEVTALDEQILGSAEAEAAKKAYETAISAEDGDAAFKALGDLIEALKAAQASIDAYAKLNNALEEFANTIESSTASDAVKADAVALYEKIANDYASLTLSNADCQAYIAAIDKSSAALRVPNYDGASDDNGIDMTQTIINPDFEANTAGQQATGWTLVKGEGASGNYQVQNGYDGGVSMEFWSNTNGSGTKYDFYQRIAALPAGTYVITADASNSYNGQTPGPGEGATYIYAGAAKGDDIRTVLSDAVTPQTSGCTEAYNKYSVTIKLAEGEDLVIGSKNIGELSARWMMIDNFTLTYYGTASSKEESAADASAIVVAETPAIAPSAIYTASGARINKLQKGINIIKMSDGSVKKIMVK